MDYDKELDSFQKKDLIDKIVKLEKQIEELKNIKTSSSINESNVKNSYKKKTQRELDFSKFKRRHIFLKFLYFGWNYNGYVTQDNTEQTVEAYIYDALLQTRLIESRESANMNRCGRTDKGVSAFSQVISLTVRSNLKMGLDLITPEYYSGPEFGLSDLKDELDYIQALNGVLPKDIRMYAWAPICGNLQASARFDCKRRTYHYYCDKSKYDLKKMNSAAKKLIGEHDFRNFCKMDVRNGVTNYVRTVFDAKIDNDGIFKIEASAFLYHQIRCIMTILMMIGSGLEEETIIDELLDIDINPAKPQYPLADELRLVLFDVFYDETLVPQWFYGKQPNTIQNVIKILQEKYNENSTKASILQSMIDRLKKYSNNGNANTAIQINILDKHKPLMKRPRCLTLEEVLEKVNFDKRNKISTEF